ncbi:type II toxin-antitoxin system VapC family toxin [Chelatococcus sp. GCM10030263]|uniref:type II toxin-antitoxin system VapC family toxin n=1 Tax=Chelatococcus sp. GCM10030263 TaxID=3273387 RepID=UPI00360CAC1D
MTNERPTIYFDANVFIYGMEKDDERGIVARRWLKKVERSEIRAVTSELTIIEVLPHPLKTGNQKLANGYSRLLKHRPALQVIAIDRPLLFHAADLRASLGMSTPDAIHVATALATHCGGFLTEDDRLRPPSPLKKLVLADLSQ